MTDELNIIDEEREPAIIPISSDIPQEPKKPLSKEDEEFNRRLIDATKKAEGKGFAGVDENFVPTNDPQKLVTVLRGMNPFDD